MLDIAIFARPYRSPLHLTHGTVSCVIRDDDQQLSRGHVWGTREGKAERVSARLDLYESYHLALHRPLDFYYMAVTVDPILQLNSVLHTFSCSRLCIRCCTSCTRPLGTIRDINTVSLTYVCIYQELRATSLLFER